MLKAAPQWDTQHLTLRSPVLPVQPNLAARLVYETFISWHSTSIF